MNQEKRKNEIVTKLLTMKGQAKNDTWKSWLAQAIDFIKEQR